MSQAYSGVEGSEGRDFSMMSIDKPSYVLSSGREQAPETFEKELRDTAEGMDGATSVLLSERGHNRKDPAP